MATSSLLSPTDTFVARHIGPSDAEVEQMLEALGLPDLDALVEATVPADIRMAGSLGIGPARGEAELLGELRRMMGRNRRLRSFIGMGYHGCLVPTVIQRNILENPGWYTAYTPYQAEIAQGRLEALLNFQTMIADLCGLPLCNASLLDEGTAAAEAMALCHRVTKVDRSLFFVASHCHPQTIAVVQARAEALGLEVRVGDPTQFDFAASAVFGALLQYPDTRGRIVDIEPIIARVHAAGAQAVVASDPLALTLLRPPGELGADVVVGSAQRLGVPMGFGGPHAAFLVTREEHRRQLPGRVIGVSRDAQGHVALRMAMQTREQHIRREKATSNICTAQVLLAVMASMYGVYHGPQGLRRIAQRVHVAAQVLARVLRDTGHEVGEDPFFDTIWVRHGDQGADAVLAAAEAAGFNLRKLDLQRVAIALDETVTVEDLRGLLTVFGAPQVDLEALAAELPAELPPAHRRQSEFMTHEVFARYQAEHELLRYVHRLQAKDLSLTTSMIPLGSCTMKLNGTS
ncbi:MAG: glycine dehydrogenase (aminomethyl-transferring), partial [Myxococcales bacterium]|nr:glycine dehydrogenase (aminomethyl-transferring) [Myxococcales bacterium]